MPLKSAESLSVGFICIVETRILCFESVQRAIECLYLYSNLGHQMSLNVSEEVLWFGLLGLWKLPVEDDVMNIGSLHICDFPWFCILLVFVNLDRSKSAHLQELPKRRDSRLARLEWLNVSPALLPQGGFLCLWNAVVGQATGWF